ncbi:hypothetical protein Mapa_002515 [Marchantia paleacea]|nr:hypothetical protein Mapa_002515 [Marchantia paleacea]
MKSSSFTSSVIRANSAKYKKIHSGLGLLLQKQALPGSLTTLGGKSNGHGTGKYGALHFELAANFSSSDKPLASSLAGSAPLDVLGNLSAPDLTVVPKGANQAEVVIGFHERMLQFSKRLISLSTPVTYGRLAAASFYQTGFSKLQWRCISHTSGQKSLEENKTGVSGVVEENSENSSSAYENISTNELLDLWRSEQEQETSNDNDPLNVSRSAHADAVIPSEDFITSELQETEDASDASDSQLQGGEALTLNDLLSTLNSIEKTDDLYAKLRPFSGKISAKDATTVMKLLNEKRLCFSFYNWVKQQSTYTADLPFLLAVVRFLLTTSKFDKLVHVTQDLFDAGFTLDSGTYCRIISHASSKSRITICEWWFQKMKERGCWPDAMTYNTMIHAYTLARLPDKAFVTFEEMKERGIQPDVHTFGHLLLACQRKGDAELVHNYFLQMETYGLRPDLVTCSILLDTYGKLGKAAEATEAFKEMQKAGITPDAIAYNSLIHAYGKAGMMDEATSTFHEYQKEAGQNPDKVVFWTMLHLYSQAGLLQQALSVKKMMRVAGLPVDASCYKKLIDGFRRREQWEDAIRGFKEMQRYKYPIDPQTYEMMMKIYTKVGHHVECERIFDQMMEKGFTKKVIFYDIMIQIYKRTENLTNATRIYELMKRNECQPNRNVCNTMIHMYAKAGMHLASERIVREMQAAGIKLTKDSFLSLIKAYAVYGQFYSARDVYVVMRETGLQPDYEIAELMVEVFVKVGQVQEAKILLKEIVDAGIKPSKRMVATVIGAGGASVDSKDSSST